MRMQKAGSYLSAPDAIGAMKSLGVAVLNIDGERQILAGGMSRDARMLIQILGINNTQPPGSLRAQKKSVIEGPVVAN